jgi:HSP20 family protein
VSSERDIFADFERMRRAMDELFGGVRERRLMPRRRDGFLPAVDVYYLGDPPRAVVRAVLAGHRQPADDREGRVYQQLEIEHGPFRRVVALGAEVDADAARALYEDGMLVVELPIKAGPSRTVQVRPGRGRTGTP